MIARGCRLVLTKIGRVRFIFIFSCFTPYVQLQFVSFPVLPSESCAVYDAPLPIAGCKILGC
jgi:hypothetical protein